MYDFAVEAQLVPVNLARQFNVKNIQNKIKKEKKDKVPFPHDHIDLLWKNRSACTIFVSYECIILVSYVYHTDLFLYHFI